MENPIERYKNEIERLAQIGITLNDIIKAFDGYKRYILPKTEEIDTDWTKVQNYINSDTIESITTKHGVIFQSEVSERTSCTGTVYKRKSVQFIDYELLGKKGYWIKETIGDLNSLGETKSHFVSLDYIGLISFK